MEPETTTATPGETAKAELARQAVILIMGTLGVLAYVWIERHSSDPDFFRAHRMRAAKASERFWARVAAASWRLAERARVEYERESA